MRLTSFSRLFGANWLWKKGKTKGFSRRDRRTARLHVEQLETRDLPANLAPFIVSVTPLDGSVLNSSNTPPPQDPAKPDIIVTYSEDVTGADDPGNYFLFDSAGNSIVIDAVSYGPGTIAGTFRATLTYNGGQPLVVDTYTLFVQGDQIIDKDPTEPLPLAQPGQLIVANRGRSNVSIVDVPGSGSIGAVSNYVQPVTGTINPAPISVLLEDVNGDSFRDLIVLHSGTQQIAIYAGEASGGFALSPDVILDPNASAGGARAIAAADLNADGKLDLVTVHTTTNQIGVYINTGTPGGGVQFAFPVLYAAGASPVGLVIADLDGGGADELDVAVVNSVADGSGNFTVNILRGNGDGTFGTATAVTIGTSSTGIQNPTGIAAGRIDNNPIMDLAVSGSNGVAVLINQNTSGQPSYVQTNLTSSGINYNAVSIGLIREDPNTATRTQHDIVAVGVSGAGGLVTVWSNDGAGVFTASPFTQVAVAFQGNTPSTTGSVLTAVKLADLNGDGRNDVVFTNDVATSSTSTGTLQVLLNNSIRGSVMLSATPTAFYPLEGNPTALALGDINNDSLIDVAVADRTGNVVSLLTGDGIGGFGQALNVSLAPATQANAVATGDLNGDGRPDIVVANFGTNDISVLIANPLGDKPQAPNAIRAADVSGDGINDLIVVNSGTNTVMVFRGLLGGGFEAQPSAILSLPSGSAFKQKSLVVADFNSDGKLDLAIANPDSKRISVFLNTSSTVAVSFATPTNLATNFTPLAIAVIDYDDDGKADLVVANGEANSSNEYTVSLFRGDGAGAFASERSVVIGTVGGTPVGPMALAVSKINSDSLDDIVVAGRGGLSVLLNTTSSASSPTFTVSRLTTTDTTSVALGLIDTDSRLDIVATTGPTAGLTSVSQGQILVFQQTADGVFSAASSFNAGFNPVSVVVRDLNGDNRGDVLVANDLANGTVTVLRNTTTAATPPATVDTVSFATPTTVNVGANPAALVLGRVDNNASPDIITANRTSHTISLVNNTTTGSIISFSSTTNKIGLSGYYDPVRYTTVTGSGFSTNGREPVSVALGDLNGDGKLDIVVASQRDNSVKIFINNISSLNPLTSSSFSTPTTASVGRTPTQVVLADINNDGHLDLLVAHNSGGGFGGGGASRGVTVRLGNGDGTFQSSNEFESSSSFGTRPSAVAVGDFNQDGHLDMVIADDRSQGRIVLRLGDGSGNFPSSGRSTFDVSPNPGWIAVADLNRDGFLDVITVSKAAAGSGSTFTVPTNTISVLLNSAGVGFNAAIFTPVQANTALQSVIVTDVNQDAFPDLVVSVQMQTNPSNNQALTTIFDNLFVLLGMGNGTFTTPVPYQAGGAANPIVEPSWLAITSNPFVRLTTFTTGGVIVNPNLAINGTFEVRDLAGEQGNLVGWQTFDLVDSHGRWAAQTGRVSPISLVGVPTPVGNFQAMLDQPDLVPIRPGSTGGNPNPPSSYAGTHVLYQDITIPLNTIKATLSLTLYIDNTDFGQYSDTSGSPSLDYRTGLDNQQVRVDIMNPLANILNVGSGVLQNLFITNPSQTDTQSRTITADLTSFAGQTIRLRIAAANNRGKLLVGVDSVRLNALFEDSTRPTITGLKLRNPGYTTTDSLLDHTTDPTIIGRVGDNGSPANIALIEIDPNGDGFGGADDLKITTWDALGNFSVTIPNLLPGQYNVGIRVTDKAGNAISTNLPFIIQGPSLGKWQAVGPGPIDVRGQGVDFNVVTGRITAIAVDPTDPSGNTFYIGSANGGIWKTTNGGNDWTPLTDFVRDQSGNLIFVGSIGGLAVAPTNNQIIYAATGIGDLAFDSRVGVGVLKSTNAGATWQLVGNSPSVLANARVTKVAVDNNDPNIVYVAVASGGIDGPGVYKTVDGGQTWSNVLKANTMIVPTLPAGSSVSLPFQPGFLSNDPNFISLPSVTDLIIDPFNSRDIIIGLGNIGLVNGSAAAGVWKSSNAGASWVWITGGDNLLIQNNALPLGPGVGRVTVAMASGRAGDEAIFYVLVGTPPPASTPKGTLDFGGFQGLYKTKDAGLNFTKVMLRQNVGVPGAENFQDIDLLGREASNVGAMVVDPANANVVYVAGSTRFDTPSALNHSIIRVDTGNMIDTSFTVNSGDDIDKAARAAFQGGVYLPSNVPYTGEGVYWFDLAQRVSGGSSNRDFLPDAFHALALDKQGRLLIGSEMGIWRGISYGFGYDFTSGGTGIIGGRTATIPGMALTSINGNLQIASLTSVAGDPLDRSRFYTAQASTGTALSSAVLQWQSMGLTGPLDPILQNLGVPSAGFVRVSAPAPGAPEDTPTTVFRSWQFAHPLALRPESSIDGGATFNTLSSAGISSNDNAGMFPPLVVNPIKIFESGEFKDELLFGTDRVYLTRTGTNVWNDKVGGPLSTQGGLISALAFAPSQSGVYWAGTNKGEVFVTLNDGLQWNNVSSGLPAQQINGITVDPNNPNVVYVMVGGRGNGHVFKTTNAGTTWTDITGSLGDFSAYVMVIDGRPAPGASGGRLYVGTDTGVYTSANGGQTWTRLGQGLPVVPVVDMNFNPNLEILAVATQGRGAFAISTDRHGPFVTGISPTTPTLGPLTTIDVTFNEPVDPRSLTVAAGEAARAQIISLINTSSEYRSLLIQQTFQKYLGRAATASDVSIWLNGFAAGVTAEQFIAQVVGSGDYYTMKGGTDSNWVDAVYLDVLGRAPSIGPGSEKEIALNLLATQSRATVAFNRLLNTNEYRAKLINEYYMNYLRRPATSAEITAGLAMFNDLFKPATDEQVLNTIVSKLEYYAKNGGAYYVGTATRPQAAAIADFNGDGLNDVAIASAGTNQILIFVGQTDGTLKKSPLALNLPSGAAPAALVAADFNADGRIDLVTANSGTNNVSVFLNTTASGSLSFGSATNFAAGNRPIALVAADFDSDGNLDIAVADNGPDSSNNFNIVVRLGNGAGSFPASKTFNAGIAVPSGSTSGNLGLAVGHLNTDGKPDLVVASTGGTRVLMNTSTGTGTTNLLFGGLASLLTTVASTSVAVGHLDHNDRLDIIVTTGTGLLAFQNLGGATPSFTSATQISNVGVSPTAVMVADLNGDGLGEVILANRDNAAGAVTVLRNTTVKATFPATTDTLTFFNPISYMVGSSPNGLALGDLNGDLVPDLAIANAGSEDFWTLLGNPNATFKTPTNDSFIDNAFFDLLGRHVDAPGLTGLRSFLHSAELVRLDGPAGSTSPLAIEDLDPIKHNVIRLRFAPQTVDGTYTLHLGPNILGINVRDFVDAGNPMNQNKNLVNGENPGDRFSGLFAINTSDLGRYVSGLFHDVLNREADTVGFLNQLTPIQNALNQLIPQWANLFLSTDEYWGNVVKGFYLNLLGIAAPSTADVNAWVNFLKAGNTQRQVISFFVSTDLYFTNAGGTAAGFLNKLWTDLLGRPIDGPSLALWTPLVTNQASRQMIANQVLATTEYRGRLVEGYYLNLLGRKPSASEKTAWVNAFNVGFTEEKIQSAFLSTSEFYQLRGNTIASFITALYQKVLNRNPSQPDLDFHVNLMLNLTQAQRNVAATNLLTSDEYRTTLIAGFYEKFLQRPGSAAEITSWINGMKQGIKREQIIATFVGSSEYYERNGSNNLRWLRQAYTDILGRPLDPVGEAAWLPLITNAASRTAIANTLLNSSEYKTNVITEFYAKYLNRTATSSDISAWLPALFSSVTNEQFQAIILATGEYFRRPHLFP